MTFSFNFIKFNYAKIVHPKHEDDRKITLSLYEIKRLFLGIIHKVWCR